MKKKSLWSENINSGEIDTLKEDLNLDILIIGGGITGLSALYYLRNTNLKIALVEKDLIGSGVSSRTTGKINYLQGVIYSDLANKYSLEVAKWYFDSQKESIMEFEKIISYEKIDCDFRKVSSYVFSSKNDDIKKIREEQKILKLWKNDVEEHLYKKQNIYAISVNDTYVFHPLKFLFKIKEICHKYGKEIYEKTGILKIKKTENGYLCLTNYNKIYTQKIILACHYPFFLIPYFMPLKCYIEKSYIVASLSDYKEKSFITAGLPCKSIRYHKDNKEYLIYLSNSSNICNSLNEKQNFKKVIKESLKMGLKPEFVWKNDDLITIDKLPYIGRIEKDNDDILIGTGYNTWGMTNGLLAGKILKDMVLEKENEYEELFNPLRIKGIWEIDKYLINMIGTMKSYIENKLFKKKNWYTNNISFKKIDGKCVAIYKDENKINHIVYNKCPHMGCSLVFNEFEKTWDCPCHASRFDMDGKCIKGPSNYDISFKCKNSKIKM